MVMMMSVFLLMFRRRLIRLLVRFESGGGGKDGEKRLRERGTRKSLLGRVVCQLGVSGRQLRNDIAQVILL